MKVFLSPEVRQALCAAAAEMHPEECFGVLLGKRRRSGLDVGSIYTYQKCRRGRDKKTNYRWVEVQVEEEERVDELLGDGAIGDFHSHPDESTTLSADDRADLLDQGNGWVSVVISVWPSKAKWKDWNFRLKAYWNDKGRIRVAGQG